MTTFRSAKAIRVFANPEMPWSLDGEKEDGHEVVDVEVIHPGFRLIHRRKPDV